MLLAVLVLVVAALAFAAGYKVAQRAANAVQLGTLERLHDSRRELDRAYVRIDHLELTIDEIRARQLETTPPLAADNRPAPTVLDPAIQAELDQIEDEEGRLEFTEQAHMIAEQYPELEPAAVLARVFG